MSPSFTTLLATNGYVVTLNINACLPVNRLLSVSVNMWL